ncbi:serine hydrolase [Altererythrobacter salegens]|uniref:Serine hydrolase n=1 Tax=Croceibacterium salegens TaxID=1737568 RepID=A0A6I4SZ32_9SPHN|nr:serine hydrolase [Croceibacterium salegens]MXO59542.1 serine hydrolase [Croceibacterium salegens]
MTSRKGVLVAALLAASAPAHAEFSQLSDAEIAARVQTVVEQVMARPEAVGLSIAVAKDDHVIIDEGVGKADLEWNVPADETSVFRIGSVTKQFTAAAIMQLVEAGKLALDDPLSKYVPEFDSGGRTITIRQLLNHASGIPNYTVQPGFFAKSAPLDLTDEQLLESVKGVDFDFEPGSNWNYSNTGYYLLGMVVAKASGEPYPDYVRTHLFQPLGLTHTYYGGERPIIPHRAQGYSYDPSTETFSNDPNISMNVPGAAGALSSTAGDLVRWQIALTGGKAVSPASYQQMITSTVPTGQGDSRYGFGLIMAGQGDETRITHTGGINGFNSILTYIPAKHMRVSVISNSEGLPSGAVENLIMGALTGDGTIPDVRTSAALASEPALRKLIAGTAAGEPDYEALTPPMQNLTRQQLPQLKGIFDELGAVKDVAFKSVDLGGADTFRVTFERGAADFSIIVDEEGKVASVNFRPVGPPPAP